jgi:glycine hydroxymethyltransferase
MLEFGKQYVGQVIDNAKALGQALHEAGFNLLGENKGFTESHQIAVDVTKYTLGGDAERALEAANIIVNRQLLPGDIKAGRHYQNPGGIRIGTSEITRIGMGKNEMSEVARMETTLLVVNTMEDGMEAQARRLSRPSSSRRHPSSLPWSPPRTT